MEASIRNQLREKIFSGKTEGEIFASSDFFAFRSRSAVDQALSRIDRDGELRRMLPGIYEVPAVNKKFNLPIPSDPEKVAQT